MEPAVNYSEFSSPQVYQSRVIPSENSKLSGSSKDMLDSLVTLCGGGKEFKEFEDLDQKQQEKLIKSLLAKSGKSDLDEISINKLVKKLLKSLDQKLTILEPVISNQQLWKILGELEKPCKFPKIQQENTSATSKRPKNLEGVKDDFQDRLAKQKILNKQEAERSRMYNEHKKRVKRFEKLAHFLNPLWKYTGGRFKPNTNKPDPFKSTLPGKKTASAIKQEKIKSTYLNSPLFGTNENINSGTPTPAPTLAQFSADSVTGEIQDAHIAFNKFKERMTKIGNQFTGQKKQYFFEQLDACGIDRFIELATERGRFTIYGIREAESLFQAEFENFHESNSTTRPTNQEFKEGNVFDSRLRKGMLEGKSNTLNGKFTEADAKVVVSDKTLQHQADERKALGHRNPNKISMSKQAEDMGYSIVNQKHKHCNANKNELPSGPENVKHIVNLLELIPSETQEAKSGILDGAKSAWADKLNVPKSSISDETALAGILFLNEDFTIERIN